MMNDNKPAEDLVSIIMSCYNSSRFIGESIESILHQTYTNFELLITDDGSTDNSQNIVKAYQKKDKRVKLFTLPYNMGTGAARNRSIQEARGCYIAFCDSDDIWLPEKLEKQIKFMKEKNHDFCFSSYYICNEKGQKKGCIIAPDSVTLIDTKRDDKIGFLTAIYNARSLGKFYMPTLRKRQDWAYVLYILQKSKKAFALKEPLACYRHSRNSISSNKLSLIRYNANVYKTVFGYSTLHSYCYLFALFLPNYALKRFNNFINNIKYRNKHIKRPSKNKY